MVNWSGPAKKHLKQIYDYIAQDSKYYAKNVARNIVDKSETLKEFPEIGRIVPEIDDPMSGKYSFIHIAFSMK